MSKRYYTIGTATSELFNEIHTQLIGGQHEGSLINRNVECVDIMEHSPTRGEFLLTDAEAEILKSDSRIKFANLTPARYPEIYNATSDDLIAGTGNVDYNRYGQTVKNWQDWESGSITGNTVADVSRTSSQLIRMKQKRNPWISSGTAQTTPISQDPVQRGAGENVDVIVADNGCWIGHVEFINPNRVTFDEGAALSPQDYTGGNVLPGSGYCDVLDVVLDGPYYIDPDWFNADPSTRLTTRFDGTTVPVESVAREWWGNSSKRSAAFAGAGTVTISSLYTRDGAHGSNSTEPTRAQATHGTQCGSLTYGRTHGWAYNANKWHINLFGSGYAGSIERGFDIQKIFHQNKPINPSFGTRDPTISSNSWGLRLSKSANYYYFQSATGTAYSGSGNEPNFIQYMGVAGDGGRWKSEIYDNSLTEAGKELVDSGVIFVVAAGNSSQMQVNPDDPNYDNHISNGANDGVYDTPADFNTLFGYPATGTTNRRGFPQHIGKTESQTFQGNTTVKFPAINVGALDDDLSTGGKERKVDYSDMGNAIDVYAPADGTLAATVLSKAGFKPERFDDSYDGLTTSDCQDIGFGGTSAACPVVAGFLATVIQYNRSWTYENIRNWIQTSVTVQDSADFYDDTRGTTATGTEWADTNRLQGGVARVLWLADVPTTSEESSEEESSEEESSEEESSSSDPGDATGVSGVISNTTRPPNAINIFANFDTTAVIDPEREYYNLPRNSLPVLNQITATARIYIQPSSNQRKLVFSTSGIDGIGYNDETFNLDTFYFKNQKIYFTVRVKTDNLFPAKFVKNLTQGNGIDDNTIDVVLKDSDNNTLNCTISSDFGKLSGEEFGGFFKGVFEYNNTGNNLKLYATAVSQGIPMNAYSNSFNISPVNGTKDFRKINEDNNQKDNLVGYLYQPNLKENQTFFTDFLGQIVGDDSDANTLGVKIYEKISNFLLNTNDVDFSNIDNLISSLKLIDSNVNKFSEQYPASLKRIVDFFSVNKSNLRPLLNKFNRNFDDKGRPNTGSGINLGPEIKLTDTLSGGDDFKPIVALEKFSGIYTLLTTDPTSSFDFRNLGPSRTYQLSSYNTRWGWNLILPTGVGDFTYLTDESDNKIVLENNFRILNESGGKSSSIIPEYYTFYEFVSTTDDSDIFSFYDYNNSNSNLDTTTLSGINNCIDEIILQDVYSGTNLI